jgi:hypothetical protein
MKIPTQIDIPAAWSGDQLKKNPKLWSYELNSEQIIELENATLNFIKSGELIGRISEKSFLLPRFGPVLSKLQNELRNGLGFKLIRGLLVDPPLPESFAQRYGSIEIWVRGGVETQETILQVPFDA